jgi:hypothetical protein
MTAGWATRTGEDVEPPTWDECAQMLLSLGGDDVLYRGHACFDWQLSSTLERALLDHSGRFDEHKQGLMTSMAADSATEAWASDVENVLMLRFRQQALRFSIPELPPLWDRLGWWEVMQHHGAPTRLLDWTTSPFVGLWFAIEYHKTGGGDMALWVYSRDTVSLNLAKAVAEVKSAGDYDLLDDRQLQNMLVQSAITGDWTALLIPVRPRQFQRAVAQQSVLTVSPRIGVARPADWWIRQRLATRIRIKEDWKPQIQAACQSMGLSRLNLFRDLDSLGASIRQNFLDKEFRPDLGLF